jgi:hypothetical protein
MTLVLLSLLPFLIPVGVVYGLIRGRYGRAAGNTFRDVSIGLVISIALAVLMFFAESIMAWGQVGSRGSGYVSGSIASIIAACIVLAAVAIGGRRAFAAGLVAGLSLPAFVIYGPNLPTPESPKLRIPDVKRADILRKLVATDQTEAASIARFQERVTRITTNKTGYHPENHRYASAVEAAVQQLAPHAGSINARATRWAWTVYVNKSAASYAGGKVFIQDTDIDRHRDRMELVSCVVARGMARSVVEQDLRRAGEEPGWLTTTFRSGSANTAADYERIIAYDMEADLIGFELVARSGLDPRMCLSWFDRTHGYTHPPQTVERLAALERAMPALLRVYDNR